MKPWMASPLRMLSAKGRQGVVVTVTVQAYRGSVWVTVADPPFVAEVILPPSHAESLIGILAQGVNEARRCEKN